MFSESFKFTKNVSPDGHFVASSFGSSIIAFNIGLITGRNRDSILAQV